MFFPEFQKFLAREHPDVDFEVDILDQIKGQIRRTIQAAWPEIKKNRPGAREFAHVVTCVFRVLVRACAFSFDTNPPYVYGAFFWRIPSVRGRHLNR